MTKNLKITYILFFVFSAILVAWNTLTNFFGGVAINFIALVGIVFYTLLLTMKNKDLLKRIKDLLLLASIFCALEFIIYFACEFGYGETLKGFIVYQNIISFLGILYFVYVAFRFTTEYLNKKIKFIEILLGNERCSPKVKKAKEISNGCLEEKPNTQSSKQENEENNEDTVIIVETEE